MTIDSDSFSEGKAAAREVKNTIKEGADQVKSSAKSTGRDVRRGAAKVLDTASNAADDLSDEIAPSLVERASEKFQGVRDNTVDLLGDLYDDTVYYVRDRPLSALAFAALGGAVIALLLRRAVA